MNDIQKVFDAFFKGMETVRAKTQMTLGKIVKRLEEIPSDTVQKVSCPFSYRGYYSDVSFELEEGRMDKQMMIDRCKETIGKTLYGYKGGEFTMRDDTPVWIAPYGQCGPRLMKINDDGTFETEEEEDDF